MMMRVINTMGKQSTMQLNGYTHSSVSNDWSLRSFDCCYDILRGLRSNVIFLIRAGYF